MLVFNMYGNLLNEQIDRSLNCRADPVAKTYQLIFLILTYCALFVYMIFAVSMREVMKRYFIEVYVLSDHQILDYIEQADEGTEDNHHVNVLFGRSWDQL